LTFFTPQFDFAAALNQTKESGYLFVPDALTASFLRDLETEALRLPLEVGDHVARPIWLGSKREVRQRHARAYVPVGDPTVPVATAFCHHLAALGAPHPELAEWTPTEVGYQLYRGPTDFISPHRDRRNDRLLSVTLTIRGSAVVRILAPNGDPDDYGDLRVEDDFSTEAGTVMFLRAQGLGSGKQVVHEVLPPGFDGRLILNLRARPDVLPPPTG
jgi:hypothetical protein